MMDASCGASKLRVKNIGAWNIGARVKKVGHPCRIVLLLYVFCVEKPFTF